MAYDALRPSGSRKAEMPFEIASSPVREEPPLARDRSTAKRGAPYSLPSPGAPRGRRREREGGPCAPVHAWPASGALRRFRR